MFPTDRPDHDCPESGRQLRDELAEKESLLAGDYPVWSPYEAHEAAALIELLRLELHLP